MYILKITGLEEQRDMQSLERTLFRLPGLNLEIVARGLKYPPLKVLSTENEGQVQSIKNVLEKFGAICEIEDVDKTKRKNETSGTAAVSLKKKKNFEWQFWLTIFGILGFFLATAIYFSSDNYDIPQQKSVKAQTVQVHGVISGRDEFKTNAEKSKEELRQDLVKNAYNADAWRVLSEKLEEEGNEAAARTAKENYERAVKAQMVLSSLAKAFGNNVRVEITEDAVYYRTSRDFTESEFYQEASRLRDSLSATFPGKRNLIIENYTSQNIVQRVRLEL